MKKLNLIQIPELTARSPVNARFQLGFRAAHAQIAHHLVARLNSPKWKLASRPDIANVRRTLRKSTSYPVSHRMTISTNIHLLLAVFTIQGCTGLKVKNILSRFLPATKWKKVVANTAFWVAVGLNFAGKLSN